MNIFNFSRITNAYSAFWHYTAFAKTKTSEFALHFFKQLANGFLTIADCIWPLKNSAKLPVGTLKSETGQATKRLIKHLKKSNETRDERALVADQLVKKRYTLQIPATGFFLGVNYLLVPFTLFQTAEKENLIASAITSANLANILSWYCYGKLDLEFLEKYGLIRKPREEDEIGRFFYGTTLFASFKVINQLNPSLSPHLNAASAIVQAPFLQKFFLDLPVVNSLNENLHIGLRHIKTVTKKRLAYTLTKVGLFAGEHLLLPKLDASCAALEKKQPAWSKNFVFSSLISLMKEQVEETAADTAVLITDKVSEGLAESIINCTIGTAKSIIYLHYLNGMLTYSLMRHPVISASQLVLSGGNSQEPLDFGLRIGGACTLLATGSTRLALTFIYLPKLAMKFLRMRGRQLKKLKREEPLLSAVKYLVGNAMGTADSTSNKDKQEIQPHEQTNLIEIETEELSSEMEDFPREEDGIIQIKREDEDEVKQAGEAQQQIEKKNFPFYINYALAGIAANLLRNKIPFHDQGHHFSEENVKEDDEFEKAYQDKILEKAYEKAGTEKNSVEKPKIEESEETNKLLAEFLRKKPSRL